MSSPSRRLPRLAAGCAAAALMLSSGAPVVAATAPSYDELLARLGHTPTVTEAGALVDAAEARVRQASVRPNPQLGLEVENVLGTGPFEGYANAETSLSISQDLELWGRRGARVSVARAEADAAGLRSALARAEAAGRLALAYAEAEAAERRAVLAAEALTLAQAEARAARALVEEGREPRLRSIQSESDVSAAQARLDEAQAERDASFARLAAVAVLSEPVTDIAAGLLDRPAGTGVPTHGALTVRVAEAERDVAERRVAAERVRGQPDVSASVGLRRFEAEDATAMTFGVSVPLPLFDRNRGNVDAARAEYRAADARLTAARQEAQADRAGAQARLRAAASRVAAADSGVSSAEEAYRLSRIGVEAGRISQLELRASRATLITARNAALDARLARVRAEIDMARLDGRAPFERSQS